MVVSHVSPPFLPQKELDLPASQILGLFNRLTKKFVQLFSSLEEGVAGADLATPTNLSLTPIDESMEHELVSSVSWIGVCVHSLSCAP